MKVFISHSSTDKKFVRTLKDDLNENGIDTWFDEDQIELGDTLSEKLESGLEESSHFLVVLSPASVSSEWVQYELNKALNKKETDLIQKIIPIKYRTCEVPLKLESFLYVDLSSEVRIIKDDRVIFHSKEYSNFLERLCREVRSSEKVLSETEKYSFKNNVKEKSSNELVLRKGFVKANYRVIAYKIFRSV